MVETSEAKKTALVEPEIPLHPGEESDSGNDNTAIAESEEHSTPQLVGDSKPPWPVVDWLPIVLTVALPIPSFRVRDLLSLEVGSVIVTEWPNGDDLPLSADVVQLAWVDMETVEQSMAVRLTRLL